MTVINKISISSTLVHAILQGDGPPTKKMKPDTSTDNTQDEEDEEEDDLVSDFYIYFID